MSDGALPDQDENRSERLEHRWAAVATSIIVLLIAMAVFAGVHQAVLPQSRVETADPRTLHLGGEFIESNLGSALQPDGSVIVRAIGQQYSFTPQCILVPTDTPITFRVTSADVVHGFLITGPASISCWCQATFPAFRRASRPRANGTCHATNFAALGMKACGAGSRSSTRQSSRDWPRIPGG